MKPKNYARDEQNCIELYEYLEKRYKSFLNIIETKKKEEQDKLTENKDKNEDEND